MQKKCGVILRRVTGGSLFHNLLREGGGGVRSEFSKFILSMQ